MIEPLAVGEGRDGVLFTPPPVEDGRRPLFVLFHGYGGTGQRELRAVLVPAERTGTVVVAPDSRGATWDLLEQGRFAGDVEFLDQTLLSVSKRCDIDPERVAIGGISDGASYALSLGPQLSMISRTLIAFSPGFSVASPPVAPTAGLHLPRHDRPVLPIDRCGARVAETMRHDGFDVTFRVFDGGHTVPPAIADEAFDWWLSGQDGAA